MQCAAVVHVLGYLFIARTQYSFNGIRVIKWKESFVGWVKERVLHLDKRLGTLDVQSPLQYAHMS